MVRGGGAKLKKIPGFLKITLKKNHGQNVFFCYNCRDLKFLSNMYVSILAESYTWHLRSTYIRASSLF